MEKYVILFFIAAQVVYSIYAALEVRKLKRLLPERNTLRVGDEVLTAGGEVEAPVAEAVLAKAEPEDKTDIVLDPETKTYRPTSTAAEGVRNTPPPVRAPAPQIEYSTQATLVFRAIVDDINAYAKKNRGSATDFAIVKDVVDRPIDAEIMRAEARTATPLYLGLAGALTGIVVGLDNMSDSIGLQSGSTEAVGTATAIDTATIVDAVDGVRALPSGTAAMDALTGNLGELLGAVSFAMWASLLGVLLTIALSLYTRRAAARVDARRNAFFSFYQVEFLPRLTRNVQSVLASLNGTLDKFNTQFGGNVEAMRTSFADNRAAVEEQQRVLESMRQLSVGGALEGTAKLYKQITRSTEAIEATLPHLARVQEVARQVGASGTVIANIAGDTERVANISRHLTEVTKAAAESQRFVARHLEDLENGKGEALGAAQQIVEGFREGQAKLQGELTRLTNQLGGIIQELSSTTETVVQQATESIAMVPEQIRPLMQEALNDKVVNRVVTSGEQAAAAAGSAETAIALSDRLRTDIGQKLDKQNRDVSEGVSQQTAVLKQLVGVMQDQRREIQSHTHVLEHMMRPWYKKLFGIGKSTIAPK